MEKKKKTLKIFHLFSRAETYGSTGKTEVRWVAQKELLKNDINFNASQQPEQNGKHNNFALFPLDFLIKNCLWRAFCIFEKWTEDVCCREFLLWPSFHWGRKESFTFPAVPLSLELSITFVNRSSSSYPTSNSFSCACMRNLPSILLFSVSSFWAFRPCCTYIFLSSSIWLTFKFAFGVCATDSRVFFGLRHQYQYQLPVPVFFTFPFEFPSARVQSVCLWHTIINCFSLTYRVPIEY